MATGADVQFCFVRFRGAGDHPNADPEAVGLAWRSDSRWTCSVVGGPNGSSRAPVASKECFATAMRHQIAVSQDLACSKHKSGSAVAVDQTAADGAKRLRHKCDRFRRRGAVRATRRASPSAPLAEAEGSAALTIASSRGRRNIRNERESGDPGGGSMEPRLTCRPVCQAVLAIQWLWSLSRLCVALTNRHSDCAAALPLRMNRSMRRLCLICP